MSLDRVTFREVFALPAFRVLFVTAVLSKLGDALAGVVLAILVYDRTGSAALAAITIGAPFLLWVLVGPVLSTIADRHPRRLVMVRCDLARGLLVGAMLIPGLPIWALLALLLAVEVFAPPFHAARLAALPDILTGDRYSVGASALTAVDQFTQVGGALLGGLLVALVGVNAALGADAASFLICAALIRMALPALRSAPTAGRTIWTDTGAGFRLVMKTPSLRFIVLLVWLGLSGSCAYEAISPAYAATFAPNPQIVGLLLAANPLGAALGSVLVVRLFSPAQRERLMVPLAAAAAGLPALCLLQPALPVITAILLASGACLAFTVTAYAAFATAVRPEWRGRAVGIAGAGLMATQGGFMLAAGVIAQNSSPTVAIGSLSALGLVGILHQARQRSRTSPEGRNVHPGLTQTTA